MAMQNLFKGENRLLSRTLLLNDGVTDLDVVSLSRAKVYLIQAGVVKHTYVLGTDAELRAGTADNELVLELTSAVTLALDAGKITVRWELAVADADFEAEPDLFIDILEETPWLLVP